MAEDTTKKAGQSTKILGDAAPEHWWDELKLLRDKVAAVEADKRTLKRKNDEMKRLLRELARRGTHVGHGASNRSLAGMGY